MALRSFKDNSFILKMTSRSFKDNCLKACKEIIVLFLAGIVLIKAAAQRIGYAQLILAVSCLLFACAHQKLRLPVEEIQRPLSLPPKNWNVGLGLGAGYFFQKGREGFDIDGKIDFTYPYLTLSQRVELYFTPLNLKYYLIRNTRIIDSTIVCTGPNWTLGGGMSGFSYSSDSGFSTSFDVVTDFKMPFNDKLWMLSSCWVDYTPTGNLERDQENHQFDIVGGVGIGCQWNQHLYSTFVISDEYHRLEYSGTYEDPFGMTTISQKWDVRLFNIYSYTGYNINKRWKIYTRPAVNFYSDGAIYGSMIFGFDYTW